MFGSCEAIWHVILQLYPVHSNVMERNYFVSAQYTACGTPLSFWALRSPRTTVTQPRASTMLIGMRAGLRVPLGGNSSHLSLFRAENEGRVGKKNNGGQLGRGVLCGRWKRRATMSLIGPECGRMLFCALTACAAMGQVTRSHFFCKFSSLSVDAFVSL